MNGQANGSVASALMQNDFDVATLRPYIGKDNRTFITRNEGGKAIAVPTMNSTATLRKDEWIQLDTAVMSAAMSRLRVVADLRSAGLVFNIPNGMGKTVLQTENMSDITDADISMDPARESENDRPVFDLTNLPLPVIHKDFFFNARQIATSRNGGVAIDTSMAQLAGRKVAEEAEKLVLGVSPSGFSYGGGVVYGLTNFPGRITKVLTNPNNSAWTPALFIREILSMRQSNVDTNHFGPWVVYVSPAWDYFLDGDYSALKGDNTVRDRLKAVNSIQDVRTADGLTGYQVVMVQMTSDVIREVIGMDITTVQWETMGGMRLHYKVMAIMVPQIRSDYYGTSGIVHGVAP